MTTEHQASRTLVKSPPELWAECSDAGSLARHISDFGEIRITRLDPESSIVWEGERAAGTVRIEPSGWGTRVTLTVQTAVNEVTETAVVAEPEPVAEIAPESEPLETPVGTESEEADEKVEETPAHPDPSVEAADPAPVRGRWKRLTARARGWFSPQPEEVHEPPPEAIADEPPEPIAAEPPPEAISEVVDGFDPDAILVAALDSLGQAHHRPFSRA